MSQKPAHAPLLPPGRHVMTIDQIKSVCVDAFPGSKQRPLLFSELVRLIGDAYYFLFEDVNGDGTYSEYLDCFLSLKYLHGDERRDADTSDYWSEIWGVGWDGRLTGFIVIKLGESDVGLRLLT